VQLKVMKFSDSSSNVCIERVSKALGYFAHFLNEKKLDESLSCATTLFEWTPNKKDKPCPSDSKDNTRDLAWKILLCTEKVDSRRKILRSYYDAWKQDQSARLFFIQAVLYVVFYSKSPKTEAIKRIPVKDKVDKCYAEKVEKIPIPDEAVDKHTSAGKKLKKGK
jgi:hypothetical protein